MIIAITILNVFKPRVTIIIMTVIACTSISILVRIITVITTEKYI